MIRRRLGEMGELWRLGGLLLLLAVNSTCGEHVRDLEISEGAPVGTRIGYIGDGVSVDSGPPYLIVPVGSAGDSDLSVESTTGEIRTKVPLDRETRASYSLVAIPISGDNIRVQVKVLDENDNSPTFPTAVMNIEFPENTPRDVKRTLHPARDLDLDIYNTQRYNIVSGNVNNAFRLSSHRERDGVLYLDLQINGFLDRETTSAYSLVIEALDGGTPPLRGEMTVNITIQDVNDNQPIFNQSRYFAVVPENATVGTNVLQIFATDNDAGENGQIEYSINRRQSDRDNMFRIDPVTGRIAVNKPLDFESKEMHELVVVARDHGLQPLETTAFVSIKVTDVNDNQPTINVIFLSDDATPKISESAQPGEFVARISVHDPDSKTEYSNINVTLSGGNGRFGLTTRDNIIYLVIVSLPLDRELQPNYTLSVVATDTGTPPLHASRTINLMVTDINDNAPEFAQEVYNANVMEVSDPGTSVVQVFASDKDEGNNSAITYSLVDTPETHSSWFQIDSRSGLVTTRAHVDCETDPVPQLTVIATDNGFPPLSSSATVFVTIHDVNDNEPIFDQSFYNVSVAENELEGHCILKVSATDPDCGVNAVVNYTLGDDFGKQKEFEVRSATGEICISLVLDYENRNVYEFPVKATDRGGLSTTAMIKIQVTDVNDNHPIFYPREYNVSLREGGASSSATIPVVVVAATDPDSGRYGSMTYRIVSGNDAGLFRIDRNTGEIFVSRPNLLSTRSKPFHHLNISAMDGGGLRSEIDAEVFISIINSAQRPPIFEQTRYTYSIKESVNRDTYVGLVKATIMDSGHHAIRYSIHSGDPDSYFRIDPSTGSIRTASNLDHENRANILLNIQGTSGNPPAYGHTQVNIEIEDVNDNSPEFESNTVRISVPESVEIGTPIYAAHAQDKDSGINGIVHYKLSSGAIKSGLFAIDSNLGSLTIVRHLDYEAVQRHSLTITASDAGVPSLSANLTVLVEVQDVNDNAPVFEQTEYNVKALESLPVNSQIVQVTAVDLDTGNNARLTYRLLSGNNSSPAHTSEIFGIFPNSGWIYLHGNLDREKQERHYFSVIATDNGTPSQTATARVVVQVLDSNDNDPIFTKDAYEFGIEENVRRGTSVGTVTAKDLDVGVNAAIRYYLISSNTSFHINFDTGEIVTKDPLDRETKDNYDLVAEARDQGNPQRSSRVSVKIKILDINDNAPEIVDPQEDVVSVREEQLPNTEVVRVRAIDPDEGNNSSITYSILKSRDSDGYGIFSIDPISGIIRTKIELDHEDKTIYRLAVAATDNGYPSKQTVRMLRVEVLDLNDNRPTFTSSSLVFKVREDVGVGHIVGTVATSDSLDHINSIPNSSGEHVTYTLTSLNADQIVDAFEIDRSIGSLIVARELDREVQSEYRLEVRALDTSTINNPQSSAVTVRIDVIDVNDNAPQWPQDPVTILVSEDTQIGTSVYNFTAKDSDSKFNGDVRYNLVKSNNSNVFTIDNLTGTFVLSSPLDFEALSEYTLAVRATDQCLNVSERLSTTVTVRVIVIDANDNAPKFIIPSTPNVFIKDSITLGEVVTRVVAVDMDSGDNGRITYIIASGNEENRFSLGYDTGIVTLAKPITFIDSSKTFNINITASDHGTPTKQAHLELRLSIQGSTENPPRFINSEYQAKLPEDSGVGTYVTRVGAKSGFGENGMAGNLTYLIPPGIADDTFSVDELTGVVTTKKILDYEFKNRYVLPIYVTDSIKSDSVAKTQFDVTILSVVVIDVNDHSPEFRLSSCTPLFIPENNELAVVHTVVAMDLDSGKNGEITYSITGGNVGNKFTIDTRTGDLTAKSLDREAHSRYHLTITAQDHGNRPLQGSCNITVRVEDQNDNDPKFDNQQYSATILEDIPIDTSVLKVRAFDADAGLNAGIIYSLANESQWLFRIDNKTGVITTTGQFDREKQSVYNFLVVASDSGKYEARFQKVSVTVHIGDINDNKPIFSNYPFKEKVAAYIQPGNTILKVSASDADQGTNSEIVYNLVNDDVSNKFRINPNTGVLSSTQSLASENGKTIYLNVIATDKGNPPQSSTGLIEISVGDMPENYPQLRFQNSTYVVTLSENTEEFKDVVKVSAVRTDSRRQKIHYFFGSGNEANIFVINSESGVIQVRNSKYLDYELRKEIRLVVEARTEGSVSLHGFCEVTVKLIDQNDNAPTFTQQEYSATVWEGNSKGAFVLQVFAFDADEDGNSRVLYHIVDGNHDNAFMIEPAFSGILKTNIVLDREIRDTYRLTVIATDEGVPQMTGTTRVRINIVDVNDNQPTFPPHSIITVSETTEVGTVLTAVTANDVDTNPPLTYSFSSNNNADVLEMFSIDRFSGKVILKMPLDYETQQQYNLKISASDTAHTAQTVLTIKITDVNDNPPEFSQNFYHTTLPDGNSNALYEILTVNATDADSEDNAKLRYSLFKPIAGFSIGEFDGILKVNLSNVSSTLKQDLQITLLATDSGSPPLRSASSVYIKVNSNSGFEPRPSKHNYRLQIPESTPKGSVILRLPNSNHKLYITEGNADGVFEILSPSAVIVLIKSLDREAQAFYTLKLKSEDRLMENSTAVEVFVAVEDMNDNAPVFQQSDYEISISEGLPIGSSIMRFQASDADQKGSDNSKIVYGVTSGNDNLLFKLEEQTGVLRINQTLDYDRGIVEHNLVIKACDLGKPSICTLNNFRILLEDQNDNAPRFPVSEYLEIIGENESIGTAIFTAHATDLDKGVFGSLNYSIGGLSSGSSYQGTDETWKLFRVDSTTGLVTTNSVFDYEQRNRYLFTLKANDIGGKSAVVKVRIEIESRDEYHPQFTERTYRFVLTTSPSGSLPIGYIVGHVMATDRDKGLDGRIVYQLSTQHQYFKVNRTSGAIQIKKKFSNSDALESIKDVGLVVTASSGRQGSLTNMTFVEISLDPLADLGTNLAINEDGNKTVAAANGGLADWALGLLIAFILLLTSFGAVLVFMHMRNKRNKKVNKPNLGNDSVSASNNYVDPSAFDTIPIRGGVVSGSNNNQFAPPKYDEIPPYGAGHAASSNSGAATTSELSGSEQSGSSGRGSAEDGEDGEDEEIRMINEGPLQRDSGIHRQNDDDDNLSDVSVRNTQEYLARLGIVNNNSTGVPQAAPRMCADPRAGSSKDTMHLHQNVPLDGLHMFEEHGGTDNDITNLIYAKLNDVAGSDRASSSGEGGVVNSTNLSTTMEHVMAIGGYGDMSTVTHQPSMNGSLSSIVHSEEELAGSYNWDYLLDWGPQYQPLAHVFSEIARLKDDTASIQSVASGNSSVKSKSSVAPIKNVPPPLITSVAPRSIAMPVLNARGGSSHHIVSNHNQVHKLPRSPISHDASGGTFTTSTAMSPSFSPSLSPLATKSPSISPLVTPGLPTSHHVVSRQPPQSRSKTVVDAELRL